MMILCSITVTSQTKEDIIEEAMKSVAFCDLNLIVHMVTDANDNTLEIAKHVAGDKYRQIDVPYVEGDSIATFRNAGLEEAARLGADWAVQNDTDDRVRLNGLNIRDFLKSAKETDEGFTVNTHDGAGNRAIVFRLPAKGQYRFPVHEEYSLPITAVMPLARMESLAKTPEQLEARIRRDIVGLMTQHMIEPKELRWPYYLGISHETLGHGDEAVRWYLVASELSEDRGMRGWCLIRAAGIVGTQDPERALQLCCRSMAYYPARPEAAVLAGCICAELGRASEAEVWANMAIMFNWSERLPKIQPSGPKGLPTYFHAPFELLAAIYGMQGRAREKAQMELRAQRATASCNRFARTGKL